MRIISLNAAYGWEILAPFWYHCLIKTVGTTITDIKHILIFDWNQHVCATRTAEMWLTMRSQEKVSLHSNNSWGPSCGAALHFIYLFLKSLAANYFCLIPLAWGHTYGIIPFVSKNGISKINYLKMFRWINRKTRQWKQTHSNAGTWFF